MKSKTDFIGNTYSHITSGSGMDMNLLNHLAFTLHLQSIIP